MEDDLNVLKMEDELNFLQIEDDLLFFYNGKQPQYSPTLATPDQHKNQIKLSQIKNK